jgi:hypothetical protein
LGGWGSGHLGDEEMGEKHDDLWVRVQQWEVDKIGLDINDVKTSDSTSRK